MATEEDKKVALGRLSVIISIYHIIGTVQMCFFIIAIMAGTMINLLLSGAFIIWFSTSIVKYQRTKRTILKEFEKKK